MRPFILTSALATTLLIGQASVRSSGSQSSLAQPTSFPLVDVQELVLDNGFKVLVVEGSQVPRVAASLWYRLGSLQERIGEHGSTHFLEHVVHQGTTTVGTKNFEAEKSLLRQIYETEQKLLATRNRERNRLRQRDVFFGDLDWPTTPEIEQLRRRLYELEDEDAQYREYWAEYNWYRRYGAVSSHTDPVPATTGHEQLEIDIDMPRENIELLFRLEADRMANAVLRGWEAQRFTVLEQILGGRQRAADPRGRFYEVINGVTGVVHPMFRRSGGHLRDFAFYNRASMLRMYDDYFVPNNATLVLVGDITRSEVELLAEQYFGRIPRGAEPPAWMDLEAEVVPGGAIRLDWSEPVDPRVMVRYRIPGVGHPDRPVFDTIAALLRRMLNSKLSEKQELATDVDFRVSASRTGSPSTIDLVGLGRGDEDLAAIESAILEVVQELRQGQVDPKTLERARKELRLDWNQIRSSRAALAYELGRFEVMDSWKTMQSHTEARERVSVNEIERAAQRYLVRSNRVIVTAHRNPKRDESNDPASGLKTGGR